MLKKPKKKPLKKNRKASDPGSGVLDMIKPVSALPPIITSVFYGRSGTGKTTLSSTFPRPILFLDIYEKGTDSIANEDKIDVLSVDDWQILEDIYWQLKDGGTKYKSVVIDAAHSMQDLAITEVKKQTNRDDSEQTTKRDFGIASGLMKTWIYNFRDLQEIGINVVFLAHDRISETEDSGDHDEIMPEVGPRVMPSVVGTLMGSVKIVGNTFIKQRTEKSRIAGKKGKRIVEYCLRLGPNEYYSTKIRSPKGVETPEYIVNPDYKDLLGIMKGTSSSKSKASTKAKIKPKVKTRRK